MKKLLKTYFNVFSTISPTRAGKQAFKLFQLPLNKKIRARDQALYSYADSFKVPFQLEEIQVFALGPLTGPKIILLHGWESNAGCYSALAFKLAEKGNRVLLFNLPAHGNSKLKKANLKICSDALAAVINHINPLKPFSIIAHSFGSLVACYTLKSRNFSVDKLVLLASLNRIDDVFSQFADILGLRSKSFETLRSEGEDLLQESFSSIVVEDMHSKISYSSALLIHDQDDKVVLKKESMAIQAKWPESELFLTKGSGHYRMLYDEKIITKIVKHFQFKEYGILDFDHQLAIAS